MQNYKCTFITKKGQCDLNKVIQINRVANLLLIQMFVRNKGIVGKKNITPNHPTGL